MTRVRKRDRLLRSLRKLRSKWGSKDEGGWDTDGTCSFDRDGRRYSADFVHDFNLDEEYLRDQLDCMRKREERLTWEKARSLEGPEENVPEVPTPPPLPKKKRVFSVPPSVHGCGAGSPPPLPPITPESLKLLEKRRKSVVVMSQPVTKGRSKSV